MALWTDVIDPVTLTGYARTSLAEYEASRGSLAQFLPNREVPDIVVRFVAGASGMIDIARWRAFDAEPEVGKMRPGRRVTIELPAVGMQLPVSEYEQLRLRNLSGDAALAEASILDVVDTVTHAVADTIERQRGIVLSTGKATINQSNFQIDDDFGRSADHSTTASPLWSSATTVSRLEYLNDLIDVYMGSNQGQRPGVILMSTRVFRSMAMGDEFQTQLLNGGARAATLQQVQDTVGGAGLPPIMLYDRSVSVDGTIQKVLPDTDVLLLPAPVAPNAWQGTDLGATFWGQTLTSTDPAFGLSRADQPGLVVGTYRNPKPPMGVEVISDAIALPVLANADRSLKATVIS